MSRMASEQSTSVMRSTTGSRVPGDSISQSRTSRIAADGKRKAAERAQEQQPVIMDGNTERTPKPLLKTAQPKNLTRRVAPAPADRRQSTATGEGGSVSIRTSRSAEERSMSHAEGSSSSSEHVSTSTPDDYTTEGMDDSTSDSMSIMDRSSISGPRRQSQISSSEGASTMLAEKDSGDKRSSDTAPKRESLMTDEPRLYVLEKNLGRKPPPKKTEAPDPRAKLEWREQEVVITLVETPMMYHFEKKHTVASVEQKAASEEMKKRNERYDAFLKSKEENKTGGKYVSRGAITLNEPMFVFRHEAAKVETANSGHVQVATYDLYDEMREVEDEIEQEEGVKPDSPRDGEDDAGQRGDGDDEGGHEEDGHGGDEGGASSSPKKKKSSSAWKASPSALETVLIVERCIVMNNYEERQLRYRGRTMEGLTDHFPPADVTKPQSPTEGHKGRRQRDYTANLQSEERDAQEEKKKLEEQQRAERREPTTQAKLSTLFQFGGESTRGMNVSCLAWNRRNPDLLASGYGEYGVPGADDTQSGYGGVVNCWSVKNPEFPERSIKIESEAGVSALHFSRQHPSLLAVGNTDGTLALYDVRVHSNSPALKTTVGTGQHTGTIWEVRWVDKGQERGETLISISADGSVMEWSIKKGLERTAVLMKLKRATATVEASAQQALPGKAGAPKEALLARQSGGMCFDMHPREAITYVVGTEDGTIHKCSKSQNENYVATYRPHGEPVYRVRWNQFCPDYFVSGSADWTSRLYHMEKPDPVATYDNDLHDAVQDLAWSHTTSTVFGTATAQGHVDLWDISDPNKPRASLPIGRPLNCIAFAEQESPLLCCGDAQGDVSVVKLYGEEFERNGMRDEEQERRFRDEVRKVSVA